LVEFGDADRVEESRRNHAASQSAQSVEFGDADRVEESRCNHAASQSAQSVEFGDALCGKDPASIVLGCRAFEPRDERHQLFVRLTPLVRGLRAALDFPLRLLVSSNRSAPFFHFLIGRTPLHFHGFLHREITGIRRSMSFRSLIGCVTLLFRHLFTRKDSTLITVRQCLGVTSVRC
jgi:hypothetical protein